MGKTVNYNSKSHLSSNAERVAYFGGEICENQHKVNINFIGTLLNFSIVEINRIML